MAGLKIRQIIAKALEPFRQILDAFITDPLKRRIYEQDLADPDPDRISLDDFDEEFERVNRARRALGQPVPLKYLLNEPQVDLEPQKHTAGHGGSGAAPAPAPTPKPEPKRPGSGQEGPTPRR